MKVNSMRALRTMVLGLLVSVGATMSGDLRAAPTCVNGSIANLLGDPACSIGGGATSFQLTSVSGLSVGLQASTQVLFGGGGSSITVALIGLISGPLPAPSAGPPVLASVTYTLTGGIDGVFNRVDLDSTTFTGASKVTKSIPEAGALLLTSTNGSIDSGAIPTGLNFLTVTDTITLLSSNDSIISVSNIFLSVPEPATLALMGASLAAFGWARRRKRS